MTVTDYSLAFYGTRAARLPHEDQRRLMVRRAIAWGLVALVHILLFSMLVISLRQNNFRLRPQVETILDLSRLSPGNAPPVEIVQPVVPRASAPVITNAPVIVVPPPTLQQAVPQTPADILKAIGEALSCEAENFENLTQAERARCKHEPWVAYKRPDGTIVLEAQANNPFSEPSVPKISGADALRHQMQTAPPCPILANVPCAPTIPLFSIPVN